MKVAPLPSKESKKVFHGGSGEEFEENASTSGRDGNFERVNGKLQEYLASLSEVQKAFFLKISSSKEHGFEIAAPARIAHLRINETKDYKRLGISIGVVACLALLCAALGLSSDCFNSKLFGTGCLIALGFCVVGAYGWNRVPADVAVDLDGLETVGQRLLQAYFHGLLVTLSLQFFTTSGLLLDPRKTCSGALGVERAQVGAWLSTLLVVSSSVSLFYAARIVTWYEMVQSIQELSCVWAIIGSIAVASMSVMLSNRTTFWALNSTGEERGTARALVILAACWGVLNVPVSLFGFLAGWNENRRWLGWHARMSEVMLATALVLFILLAFITFEEVGNLDSHCIGVLQLMGREYFVEFFNCEKYAAIQKEDGNLRPPVCERLNAENESRKDFTTVFWESYTCLVSCVSPSCCEKMSSVLHSTKSSLVGGGIWFLLLLAIVIWSSRYIARETAADGRILHHKRSFKFALLCACIIAVGSGLLIASLVSNSVSFLGDMERGSICNHELNVSAIPSNTTISSCENNKKDGKELYVDCGGPDCQPCVSRDSNLTDSEDHHDLYSSEYVVEEEKDIRLRVVMRWGSQCGDSLSCDEPVDLDLKVGFLAGNGNFCVVGPLENVNSECGGVKHLGDGRVSGEEKLEFDEIGATFYAVYIENRVMDFPLELSGVKVELFDHEGSQIAEYLLPEFTSAWSFDLLGLEITEEELNRKLDEKDITPYSFARMLCLDARDGEPTIKSCSQFVLSSYENRVFSCIDANACSNCEDPFFQSWWYIDADNDGFGDGDRNGVRACYEPESEMGLVGNNFDCNHEDNTVHTDCNSNDPQTSTFSAGWYLDPQEFSSFARSCDAVCSSLNLTCSDQQMNTIQDLDTCRAALRSSFQKWCSPQDLTYTYNEGSFVPKAGGAFQIAAKYGQASCLCTEGIFPSREKNAILLNGSQYEVRNVLDPPYVDPGASCADEDQILYKFGQGDSNMASTGTFIIEYSCCTFDNSSCATMERYIIVDDQSGDCSSLFDSIQVNEDRDAAGGCVSNGKLFTTMNNENTNFPDPVHEFYYATFSFPFSGSCSERPDIVSDRRVCFCE